VGSHGQGEHRGARDVRTKDGSSAEADYARARINDLKKQRVTSPAPKREQPASIAGMLRCESYPERTACELNKNCS
jgi:hypothetical protein